MEIPGLTPIRDRALKPERLSPAFHTYSGLRFLGLRTPDPAGARLRPTVFFGFGGGGFGSKIVGCPSTIGCGSSSSSITVSGAGGGKAGG